MKLRKRSLPPGWYPGGEAETLREIRRFEASVTEAESRRATARPGKGDARLPDTEAPVEDGVSAETGAVACAGVAPHAGWTFSGRIAFRVLRSLPREMRTLIVVGGHMHPRSGVAAALEDGFQTPLGTIEADRELLDLLRARLEIHEDRQADNTVEIHLPLVKYLFPAARVVALRCAPSEESLSLGEVLADASRSAGLAPGSTVAVLGSTDLTHYGPNYGFVPKGPGPDAVAWVREVNDRRFVDALKGMDLAEALRIAERERSACSAGGAVAAARFAQAAGCRFGRLLEYLTSHDVYPGDSFVGYAGLIYPVPA
jgi:AmmeMemoRadiSam system protein B